MTYDDKILASIRCQNECFTLRNEIDYVASLIEEKQIWIVCMKVNERHCE
jgi:hypothetical protein